jgi:hypothetical protein
VVFAEFCSILRFFALISGALRGNLWTENPCVPGSIPGGTTQQVKQLRENVAAFFMSGVQ